MQANSGSNNSAANRNAPADPSANRPRPRGTRPS